MERKVKIPEEDSGDSMEQVVVTTAAAEAAKNVKEPKKLNVIERGIFLPEKVKVALDELVQVSAKIVTDFDVEYDSDTCAEDILEDLAADVTAIELALKALIVAHNASIKVGAQKVEQ